MFQTEVNTKYMSPILPCKRLVVNNGLVTHQGEHLTCRWCQWSPRPEDINGVDGLLLGGFAKVTHIAKLAKHKHYRLAVHSCQRRQANPMQVLTMGNAQSKAEASPKERAEAQPVEVG